MYRCCGDQCAGSSKPWKWTATPASHVSWNCVCRAYINRSERLLPSGLPLQGPQMSIRGGMGKEMWSICTGLFHATLQDRIMSFAGERTHLDISTYKARKETARICSHFRIRYFLLIWKIMRVCIGFESGRKTRGACSCVWTCILEISRCFVLFFFLFPFFFF